MELRAELLNLCKTTRRRKAELEAGGLQELQVVCAQADELADRVKSARDNALSAEVFADLSDVGAKRAQRLIQDPDHVSVSGFISMLKKGCLKEGDDAGDFDWGKLGGLVHEFIKPTVGISCMLGAMSVKAKAPRTKTRRPRESVGDLVEPERLEKVARKEDINKQTDKMMEVMMRVLKNETEPVPFVELVLNHDSFAQTIENVFALSFLVKDKRVDFSHDEEKGVTVSWKHKGKSGGKGGAEGKSSEEPRTSVQSILSFNYEIFNVMKSLTRPENCKMPLRPRVTPQQNTQNIPGPSTSMEVQTVPDSAEASQVALPPESPSTSIHQVSGSACNVAGKDAAPSRRKRTNENKVVQEKSRTTRKRKAERDNTSPRKRAVLGNSDDIINSPPPVPLHQA